MKKNIRLILIALVIYVLILGLLVIAESRAPDATIHSIWDAVWYSLITLTTVGYGDLSPVTGLGRVLGMIFALCSLGILTAIIGVGLRLIGGCSFPDSACALEGTAAGMRFPSKARTRLRSRNRWSETIPTAC